jgi:hypothetical protein
MSTPCNLRLVRGLAERGMQPGRFFCCERTSHIAAGRRDRRRPAAAPARSPSRKSSRRAAAAVGEQLPPPSPGWVEVAGDVQLGIEVVGAAYRQRSQRSASSSRATSSTSAAVERRHRRRYREHDAQRVGGRAGDAGAKRSTSALAEPGAVRTPRPRSLPPPTATSPRSSWSTAYHPAGR